ncbi:unnamed protein product [Rotaria socialis]|uniref:Fatty acid hydroxylase domain-containing protein n=2 Tax=Rotaria socialis TaxID=392032 RepID=A0A821T856_9BILA|nr:unnamed protein product [Rotaria socialis]
MAGYIAHALPKTNWTVLSQSAFQMNQCNNISYNTHQPLNRIESFKIIQEMKTTNCYHRVFVYDSNGSDLFDGTFERPMKTIQTAVSLTRILRTVHDNDKILCITIRGGIYYLDTNATTTSSQIGAITLTTNDSNLVIENYQNEHVILNGGTLLKLQWSVHVNTSQGGTIMKAQIPSCINLEQFNELYIDGLYAKDPGFSYNVSRWLPPTFNKGASVFNSPSNLWSTDSPPYDNNYVVPRGLIVNNGALPHIGNWSKPTTGFVHAFHSDYWGSWFFEIASINSTQNTIVFGRGSFQEARGAASGGAFYVVNIFEEFDSPNEWFLDKDTRTLYFMPNETMPQVFVISQISCLISISGSSFQNSAENISIQGLTLTETSHTYMRDYMVPSGDDWAVHRGGTLYLINTKNITITRNIFIQLGSNGMTLIDYNYATSIMLNEFVWLADSAIILVGSTNGIDGFSVTSQPVNTLIQSNLIHETGIYIKQSSPVLIAVSRSVSIIGNLMFNIPRAAINVNDGFYETSDHGPINTWDRQPFLSDAVQSSLPSVWQHKSFIHHNTLFNNYNSFYPIDHDDGSCFYEDSDNFQVYGDKKHYLGHSQLDHQEINVYPDTKSSQGTGVCIADQAPSHGSSSWNETWIANTFILYTSPIFEWLTFTICIYFTFQTVFWLYNLFLIYIEFNDIPSIDKYRIQKHKVKLRFQPEMIRQMKEGTIKHQLSLILTLPLLYYLLNYFGHISVRSSIPSLLTITYQIILFILGEDFLFYWTHYLFHTPWLYKHIHKKHHIFKQPTGVVFVLADPWESLLQNQVAVWLVPIVLKEKHLFTICLWIFIRVYQTINAHSGYDLPYISPQYYFPWLLSGTLQHDYHHQYAKMNYGSFLTLWDRLMNTHKLKRDN